MPRSRSGGGTSSRGSEEHSVSAGCVRPNERRGSRQGGGRRRIWRERNKMRLTQILLAGAAAAAMMGGTALADDPIGKGVSMYMQMGGNAGDGATLARQTGATQAAAALGVDLKAQFSSWAPETMINQFKEAVAAKPNCIEIMGHPGGTAFHDIVKSAVDQGIVVTVGN